MYYDHPDMQGMIEREWLVVSECNKLTDEETVRLILLEHWQKKVAALEAARPGMFEKPYSNYDQWRGEYETACKVLHSLQDKNYEWGMAGGVNNPMINWRHKRAMEKLHKEQSESEV